MSTSPNCGRRALVLQVVLAALFGISLAGAAPDYAVVVSQATRSDKAWNQVTDALRREHRGRVIEFTGSVDEVLPDLRQQFPRYVCFVARPTEATRQFVAQVHRLTRRFDDDPYTDCFWGILTGYDATDALRAATRQRPLTVRRVAAGTDIALDQCEEGVWYCELKQGRMVRKKKGGVPTVAKAPDDTTEALVKSLTDFQADLFVTSGHATERDWMIGFRYRNGFFKCENGQLYGLDTRNRRLPIHSPNPKVYLPIGNCLMGHIDGQEAMALAWMHSAGVRQMIGYTVPTWYGYAGWGCLDYFVEQPGRYTFAEAFFANQAALIHRLDRHFPGAASTELDTNGRTKSPVVVPESAKAAGLTANDARGLLFDRDVVAFYGDPAWTARMAPQETPWRQTLAEKKDLYAFEITPKHGTNSFAPINLNGSQRGGRPLVQFLKHRIRERRIIEGAHFEPVITDDFILVPRPFGLTNGQVCRIVFQAKPVR